MQWISQYGLFLAQAITVVVAIAAIVLIIARARQGEAGERQAKLKIRPWHERIKGYQRELSHAGLEEAEYAAKEKARAKKHKQEAKALKKSLKAKAKANKGGNADKDDAPASTRGRRVFVLDFVGDIKASGVESLAEQITALEGVLGEQDEVVLRLESGGGLVHAYGLAAAQLDRLRASGARLTITVDKVAASGGYMMACAADHVVAAPFAVIGSIGVVAQVPNVHRLLKKHDVDVEILTAGRYKRTLTMLGENSEEGREKFLSDLARTHELFKQHVGSRRPQLDVEAVSQGDIWYGSEAIDIGLIDEVGTSQALLARYLKEEVKIFEVSLEKPRRVMDRFGKGVTSSLDRVLDRVLERNAESRWHQQ
ncbi:MULTISPECIES: protease SohB [Cobetia]|jgi:serine protease SohB|uniref:Protease SohB n=1 Tax=Cobetia amphilecti TaxID=1055104 RepID=A0AAP4WXY5_9GAMM|nr:MULTISPECIES: protease SohB [Cobetia]MBR9753592.1 protease SohB [Gammaproteobacteria bacterium]KPM80622.1 peptidase [Cobetia sp. UCD-24C]MCK8067499.1 protease SohB [Cobetia sp. 1CM21F]MDO6671589.1 protease SohB [Cobetia amphilecti]QWN38384.1 protease SohB [Cobetia sp. 4B]